MMRRLSIGVALAALLASGCGGGRVAQPPGPAPVERIDVTPQKVTPLGRVQQANIASPEGSWLASADGAIFVKQDGGVVQKIDPARNRIVAHVRADTKSKLYCQGIGAGGGWVWSCSGGDVVQIDPHSVKVVKSIPVRKVFDQGRLVYAAGRIWVLTGNGDELVGIDARTGRPGAAIALPVSCNELGPGGQSVWAICPQANTVVRVDPRAGKPAERYHVIAPTYAYGSSTDVWVGSDGALVRYDRDTQKPVATFAGLDPTDLGDLWVDGDAVWVRNANVWLDRIDATTNAVAEQVRPPRPSTGGSVLLDGTTMWTADNDDARILRLRLGAAERQGS